MSSVKRVVVIKRTLQLMLIGLLSAYVGVSALAFVAQRRLIYPRPAGGLEPRIAGAQLERITDASGELVACALYVAASEGRPTVVHFHGNGEDLADQEVVIDSLRARGLGVYAVEYPGYGLLRDRAPTEASLYAAAEAALHHLHRELGVAPADVVLQGQSLGTGVAAELALRAHAARVVLISPFTSMTAMARRVLPVLPVSWLVRDRYDTEAKAKRIRLPALVIHGTADPVIPVQMGRQVSASLPNARFVPIAGAGHNDLFHAHRDEVVTQIASFALTGR